MSGNEYYKPRGLYSFRNETRIEYVKISATTNDINAPNYFEDYYEEKRVKIKVKR